MLLKPGFRILGHRGARARHPENTLEGFRACLAAGIDAFETDIAITKDGVAVLHHDAHLSPMLARGPDGAWVGEVDPPLIKDLDVAQLQEFDLGTIRPGSALAAQFPLQVSIPGARAPRLADVLALPIGHVFIELKIYGDHPEWTVPADQMVARVLRDIEAAGAAGRVTLQSFHWDAVRLCRDQAPHMPRAWLTAPSTLEAHRKWGLRVAANPDVPQAIAAEGGGTWTSFQGDLTDEDVCRAQTAGVAVIPWTVNDVNIAARLAAWGVDGLISDDPMLIQAIVA